MYFLDFHLDLQLNIYQNYVEFWNNHAVMVYAWVLEGLDVNRWPDWPHTFPSMNCSKSKSPDFME